jgi:hypothetical protein
VTDFEERLSRDLKELSERAQPGSIRPLREPRARRWPRAVRWLAPAAAVAAVLSVIAGVAVVSRSAGGQPASREGPGRMPAWYVIAQSDSTAFTAIVRDSATGRVLARVPLPNFSDLGPPAITASADDRTFVITDGNDLFRLRVAADGRSAGLSRLPITVPPPSALDNVALSPDGSTVAIENQSSCSRTDPVGCRDNVIRLVSLATGATRTWSARASWQWQTMWISWAGNDHVLFSWASASAPQQSGYRLLDIRAAGSNLLAAPILPLPPLPVFHGFSFEQSAFITPDGTAVIASTFSMVGPTKSPTAIMKIVEQSARTGRVLGVLLEAREHYQFSPPVLASNEGCQVYSLGPTGVHALIECSNPSTVFGRLDNGRFTPLPGLTLDQIPGYDAAW